MRKCFLYGTMVMLFLLAASVSIAQPFAEDIAAFKKADSIAFPPKKAILFIGSSSFTMWKNVQQDFPGYTIINRGFGGSSLPDITRYADDIIFPYDPKQIVIYCGENDLAASDTVTAQTVIDRFKSLFFVIRHKLPEVPIVFISLKPSPSRENLWPIMADVNKAIKIFLMKKTNVQFIDVFHEMLKRNGTLQEGIFLEDGLHMNAKGYAIWQRLLLPVLIK